MQPKNTKSFLTYALQQENTPLPQNDNKFLKILGYHFEDIAEGRYPILLVSMPPRTGKTTIAQLFLSWLLSEDPSTYHFVTTFSPVLSKLIKKRVELLENSATSNVHPTAPGSLVCDHYYGGFNGVSGVWLIDDYHKSFGEGVNEEWLEHIWSRRLQNSAVVVLGTRRGENDIFNYFLGKFGYFDRETNPQGCVHINLQAIIDNEAEAKEDILGRSVGETLNNTDKDFSLKRIEVDRKGMGKEKFSWLFKGRPFTSEVPKNPKITHVSQLPELSSWRRYKRSLLELELNGVSSEEINDFNNNYAKESFVVYLRKVMNQPSSSFPLDDKTYEIIGSAFEDIAESRYPVLLISMPPNAGKTTLSAVFLSWLIGKDPRARHIDSAGDKLLGLHKMIYKICESDSFKEIFPDAVVSSRQTFFLNPGGSICGHGFGNTASGPGFGKSYYCDKNLTPGVWLVDDFHGSFSCPPLSYSRYEGIGEWVDKEALTRGGGRKAIVVVGSRRGEDDIFGCLLTKFGLFDPETNPQGCVHINLSAVIDNEAEAKEDILGRSVGETLSNVEASFLSSKGIEIHRRDMVEESFSWLFKGRPPTQERSGLGLCDEVPPLDKVIISVDPAPGPESLDNTAICIAGVSKQRDRMYVLDFYEGKWDLKTVGLILSLASKGYGAEEVVLESCSVSSAWAVYLQDLGLRVSVGRRQLESKGTAITKMIDSGKVILLDPNLQNTLQKSDHSMLSDTACAILVSYQTLLPAVY